MVSSPERLFHHVPKLAPRISTTNRVLVKIHIKSRIVTLEGPRGIFFGAISFWQQLTWVRETREEHGTFGSLLLAPSPKHRQHRITPWRSQECGYTSHSQDPHQQPDNRRHKGLQVQDAICLRTFPHQRQPREEFRDWSLRG